MGLKGRKIAITGAGKGLGAALAIAAADAGMVPLLLGRKPGTLAATAEIIETRSGRRPEVVACDLADSASIAKAAACIANDYGDLDVLVNSGSQWVGGAFEALTDEQIAAIVDSTVTGTMALTRRLLPVLRARPQADLHTVVSMSGLPYARMRSSSAAFVAAKAAQSAFVQALTEELIGTSVRVTSVYPGHIEDVLPGEPAWNEERGSDDMLSDRNVVEAILYILSQPANVAIRTLVIERTRTEFLS